MIDLEGEALLVGEEVELALAIALAEKFDVKIDEEAIALPASAKL